MRDVLVLPGARATGVQVAGEPVQQRQARPGEVEDFVRRQRRLARVNAEARETIERGSLLTRQRRARELRTQAEEVLRHDRVEYELAKERAWQAKLRRAGRTVGKRSGRRGVGISAAISDRGKVVP